MPRRKVKAVNVPHLFCFFGGNISQPLNRRIRNLSFKSCVNRIELISVNPLLLGLIHQRKTGGQFVNAGGDIPMLHPRLPLIENLAVFVKDNLYFLPFGVFDYGNVILRQKPFFNAHQDIQDISDKTLCNLLRAAVFQIHIPPRSFGNIGSGSLIGFPQHFLRLFHALLMSSAILRPRFHHFFPALQSFFGFPLRFGFRSFRF